MASLSNSPTLTTEDVMNEPLDPAEFEAVEASLKVSPRRRKAKPPKPDDHEDSTPLDIRPDGIYWHAQPFECD
jgi:hypothetical protein